MADIVYTYPPRKLKDLQSKHIEFKEMPVEVYFVNEPNQGQGDQGIEHVPRDPNFLDLDNIPELSEHVVSKKNVQL